MTEYEAIQFLKSLGYVVFKKPNTPPFVAIVRTCPQCGEDFPILTRHAAAHQRYCAETCQKEADRVRKQQQRKERKKEERE